MENKQEKKDITLFAETTFRNENKKFGIKTDDRRRHVYLIGKTGMGKTTMMENMIYQDIHDGRGVALVDPHGDFVEKILDYIPSSRINDVVYFNPSDTEYPVSLNILESLTPEAKNIAASGLIGIFKKLWSDSWGPRLEYLLRNAILALMDCPNSTILGVMRILVDKNFRKKVVDQVKDPVVKSFWEDEYTKYSSSFQVEAISPIQNKVGQFLSNSLIRNIIGQVKSSIDIRDVMDGQKILLMNLSKGRIGEDASALLGAMMITKIQLTAMERVNMPESERKDFFLYVDEFQNFATESFANILSEARKYRLSLTVTNQYIEQLDEQVRAAIFGNVGTLISFRVGAADADALEKEFFPRFTPEDLVNLTKFHIYIKLMIDGIASEPFSAVGLPPLAKKEGNAEKVINASRERYGKPKEIVEEKIAKWVEGVKDGQNKGGSDGVGKKQNKNFDASCSYCGVKTKTSFKPDGVRPVFCENCLTDMRNKELIIEKNQRGEYVVIKEPLKEDDSRNIDGLKKRLIPVTKDSAVEKKSNSIKQKKEKVKDEISFKDIAPQVKKRVDDKTKKPGKDNTLKPGEKVKF